MALHNHPRRLLLFFFFFNDTATTEIYTLSLHDALPICDLCPRRRRSTHDEAGFSLSGSSLRRSHRSEEHTSELQSPCNLVCRLLLEKKKKDIEHVETRHTRWHLANAHCPEPASCVLE